MTPPDDDPVAHKNTRQVGLIRLYISLCQCLVDGAVPKNVIIPPKELINSSQLFTQDTYNVLKFGVTFAGVFAWQC